MTDISSPIKSPYRIWSAGMPRSGSTWLYNVTRLMVAAHVGADFGAGFIHDIRTAPQKSNMVIKGHGFDQDMLDWSTHVVFSYRDVRDFLASRSRMWGKAPTMGAVNSYIKAYKKVSSVANFSFGYDRLHREPEKVVGELAVVLKIPDCNPSAILSAVDALRFDKVGAKYAHSDTTLLHKQHITDGRSGTWVGQISPDLIRRIEDKHHGWLTAHGFALTAA